MDWLIQFLGTPVGIGTYTLAVVALIFALAFLFDYRTP